MKKKAIIPAVLLIVVAAGGLLYFPHARPLEKAAAAPAAPPAVPIVAGVVAQHDVPIYLSGVGTVIAYNTDVVRAQIQGQIISINFTEGQNVHAGDLPALSLEQMETLTRIYQEHIRSQVHQRW